MDNFSVLPTPLLVNIHERLSETSCVLHEPRASCNRRGVRNVMALEATCKELRKTFHENTRIPSVLAFKYTTQKPGFWRWLARHGRRVDHFALTIDHDTTGRTETAGSFPMLCYQAGVLAVKALHIKLRVVNTLHELHGLPNLTGLHWSPSSPPGQPPTPADPIAWLAPLKELTLCDFNANSAALALLGDLPSLTQLEICNAFSLPSLDAVARLKATRLQRLTLARLALVTTLDPLSSLSTLTHLHLSGCYAVGSLAPLRALVDLQYLNLRDMGRAAASSLQFLTELTQLQNLCLTTTSVIDGSRMHLRPLTSFLGDRIELHVFSGQAASSMAASLIDTYSANLKALWLLKLPPLGADQDFLSSLPALTARRLTCASQCAGIPITNHHSG
jgi:hypothetical protein